MANRKRKEPKITTLEVNNLSRTVSESPDSEYEYTIDEDALYRDLIEKPQMNSYDNLVETVKDLVYHRTWAIEQIKEWYEENSTLLNRCRVAEDLNKVYVRMYLELQEKFDRVVKVCSDSVL